MTGKPAKSTAPVLVRENLQGLSVDGGDLEALRHAIDIAFDYRGDVMIGRKSDGSSVEGYIFDRRGSTTSEIVVRLIPKDSDERVMIPLADIAWLKFSGKDTASGKSFENWIKKYAQKKLAGETASIESESLDE